MASPFGLIIVVDWSAAARPARGRDSLWTAGRSAGRHGTVALEPVNHPTRAAAIDWLVEVIAAHSGSPILIGIDASLGAPAGVARAVGGRPGWESWWETVAGLVVDRADNSNNRWEVAAELNRRIADHLGPDGDHRRREPIRSSSDPASPVPGSAVAAAGPFWGGPAAAVAAGLERTRPPFFTVPEYRRCEIELRRLGRRPFPLWQLAYAGSVGSQALLAVAALAGLRRRLGDRLRVWPFEAGVDPVTELAEREDQVIVAEVWPSMWPLDLGVHPVRDAAQVGELAGLLADAPLVDWLGTGDLPEIARAEEGWVLGLPAPPADPAPGTHSGRYSGPDSVTDSGPDSDTTTKAVADRGSPG